MDPTDLPDGRDAPEAGRPSPEAQARRDRRAEALRANLRRRKAQARGRADAAERAGPTD